MLRLQVLRAYLTHAIYRALWRTSRRYRRHRMTQRLLEVL